MGHAERQEPSRRDSDDRAGVHRASEVAAVTAALHHGRSAARVCRLSPAAVRADWRRLQHRIGHSRRSGCRWRMEARSARDAAGFSGGRVHAKTLLGAKPLRRKRTSAAPPNDAHRSFAFLERQGRIEQLVTQKVDGLHQAPQPVVSRNSAERAPEQAISLRDVVATG